MPPKAWDLVDVREGGNISCKLLEQLDTAGNIN